MTRLDLALAAVLVVVSGCRREEVTHFQVPKSQGEPAPAAVAPRALGTAAEAPEAPPLEWELPAGWTESRPGGMRFATLKPKAAGNVDVSVIVLPGPAGGELANVSRWRGQIGLHPIDEPALAAARKTIKAKAGAVSVFDFTSEGAQKSRLVAALATAGDYTWFVKMTGDAAAVGAARADFTLLLQSLHFHAKKN